MNKGLLNNSRIYASTGVVVTGATDKFSPIIDMRDAEGCLFIVQGTTLGTGASTGAMGAFRIQGGPNNSTVGMVNISPIGSPTTAGVIQSSDVGVADNFDRSAWAIDVLKPVNRFTSSSDGTVIRYIRGLASNSSNMANITAIAYGLRFSGSTNTSRTAESTFFASAGTTTVLAAATS